MSYSTSECFHALRRIELIATLGFRQTARNMYVQWLPTFKLLRIPVSPRTMLLIGVR